MSTFEQQIITLQEVERYRAQARAMQSRETARLARRLFGAPARLLRRAAASRRSAPGRRDERPAVTS